MGAGERKSPARGNRTMTTTVTYTSAGNPLCAQCHQVIVGEEGDTCASIPSWQRGAFVYCDDPDPDSLDCPDCGTRTADGAPCTGCDPKPEWVDDDNRDVPHLHRCGCCEAWWACTPAVWCTDGPKAWCRACCDADCI